ncbi:MAG TPA: hypothetical protein VN372_10105 [Methanospirillum sp.]|nr:hypothetical protein [Methanospirillum sp.]
MDILSESALTFFSDTGFSRVTIMGEEVQDPKITISHSLYLALGISTVIYFLVSIVSVGLAGTSARIASDSPLAAAMEMTNNSGAVQVI